MYIDGNSLAMLEFIEWLYLSKNNIFRMVMIFYKGDYFCYLFVLFCWEDVLYMACVLWC